MRQLKLNLDKGRKGGRREGSGRKRIHSKGVAHRPREQVNRRTPLHINFKYKTWIKNKFCLCLLKRAILNSRKQGLRIIHFSLQTNHVHLIVEAETNQILESGMRSLTVTFAKGLGLGKVQMGRYHLHVLKSLQETKNAVNYVLFNKQKHEKGAYSVVDHFSSLFGMEHLIKAFAKKNRITIKKGVLEQYPLDKPTCYLLLMSLRP